MALIVTFYLQKDETIIIVHARAPRQPSHITRKRAIRPMPLSPAFLFFPESLEGVYSTAHAAARKSVRSHGSQRAASDGKYVNQRLDANRVLLLGRVQELAMYRAEVLRDRGFEVRTSTNKEEALKLIRRADFDVVVLSYTLSERHGGGACGRDPRALPQLPAGCHFENAVAGPQNCS